MKNLKDILAADLAKNYRNENVSVDEYFAGFKKLIDSGTNLNQVGNTLFVYKKVCDDAIEFHAANAENARMLIRNCKDFLQNIANQNIHKAITFFDNPKLKVIFDGMGFPYVTEKVNQGKYATYKTEVSL